MEMAAHEGRSITEKFEEIAKGCSFAIFILSADDELVDVNGDERIKRGRQNVILEVGYFWGALGRGDVAFLVENDPRMDLPVDLQGIGWIGITSDLGTTKLALRKELAAAGLISN